jgi:hypothetical protein
MREEGEILRYIGGETANLDYHHGRLRPVMGVQNRQVLRANRAHPEWADGFGWTYNHAPMLAYWKGRFYLEYLSNPVGEHAGPGQTLLVSSEDGIRWSKPRVVFPVYRVEEDVLQPDGRRIPAGTESVMHQRMGFYLAPNRRMLISGFYGICLTPQEKPNDGRGIGRVVRELQADGRLGPIYFIRYNRHAGWNEANTGYPLYTASEDRTFVEACEALLSDRLATLQWWEEDRSPDGFYPKEIEGLSAFCSYRRDDGGIVGLWKNSRAGLSRDGGHSWMPVRHIPSLIMAGGKIWGERTSDGAFALVYNPSPEGNHRWPLALLTSSDGETFDRLRVVNGDIAPRRYGGQHKNYGHSYTRGIEAADGPPPRGSLWIAYSANKEDLWVSEIPVPIRDRATEHVADTFNEMQAGGPVPGWNLYSPLWAPVTVAEYPSAADKSLLLEDRDPADYARAERMFPECGKVRLRFTLLAAPAACGRLEIEVCEARGTAPVRIRLDGEDDQIRVLQKGDWRPIGGFPRDTWHAFEIRVDTGRQKFRLEIDGVAAREFQFTAPAYTVERLVFRTGAERRVPNTGTGIALPDLSGVEEPLPPARYYINRVETSED